MGSLRCTRLPVLNAYKKFKKLLRRIDKVDCVFDGLDFFSRIVRNFDPEFLFKRHNQLNRIKAVRAQSSMKLAFSVTLSSSTPRCSTTIFFTLAVISLIGFSPCKFRLKI